MGGDSYQKWLPLREETYWKEAPGGLVRATKMFYILITWVYRFSKTH